MRRAGIARLVVMVALFATGAAHATSITIHNDDAAGTGFNDVTPVTPTGGNTAITLGQARLNVVQAAANLWAGKLTSSIPIVIGVSSTALDCSASEALLAQTAPTAFLYNFTNAPLPNVYYPIALADALSATDLGAADTSISNDESIQIEVNSAINGGTSCLGGYSFYLGLDDKPGASQIDLLAVLSHEIAHGLGYMSIVDPATGQSEDTANPTIYSIFDQFVYDETQAAFWTSLSAAQIQASAVNNGNLSFNAARPNAVSSKMTAGASASGHLLLYAPTTVAPGSSVSHWDVSANPTLLMQPFIEGTIKPLQGVDMTTCALGSLGWSIASGVNCPDGLEPYLQAPTALAAAVSGFMNGAIQIVLNGTSPDGSTLSYVVTTKPTHGNLSGTAPNLVYTPNSNFVGADSMAFTVSSDSGTSTPATVSIAVQGPVSYPSASSSGGGALGLDFVAILSALAALRRRTKSAILVLATATLLGPWTASYAGRSNYVDNAVTFQGNADQLKDNTAAGSQSLHGVGFTTGFEGVYPMTRDTWLQGGVGYEQDSATAQSVNARLGRTNVNFGFISSMADETQGYLRLVGLNEHLKSCATAGCAAGSGSATKMGGGIDFGIRQEWGHSWTSILDLEADRLSAAGNNSAVNIYGGMFQLEYRPLLHLGIVTDIRYRKYQAAGGSGSDLTLMSVNAGLSFHF